MLNYKLLADQGILIVMPSGRVTRTDFEKLVEDMNVYLRHQPKIKGLMVCSESFHGWQDFGALVSHLKFIREQHRFIERVAIVTDSKIMGIMPLLIRHFSHANIRHFADEDQSAALAWLEG